ncbi:MAG: RtcB family protein [Candidatus Omnitrophica bacterium]|nr:RtcB family protein [Candidatus Omnitrophota bacterium]
MEELKVRLERKGPFTWFIPRQAGMNVPGILYVSEKLLEKALSDNAVLQVANVARLPGIVKASLAMPDVHWGYGAPIGGVGAFDGRTGVIVPGFVGYDINCGVRLLKTNLSAKEVRPKLEVLLNNLFQVVPSGVGSTGQLRLKKKVLEEVVSKGARWAVEQGYGSPSDLENIEENGCLAGANPESLSQRAVERGLEQLETLGSGNHFLEIQQVEEVYDEATAKLFRLFSGQITVMVHTGSRGLGYQVCDDYLAQFGKVMAKYGITVPDRQLACAPVDSYEGKRYFQAMKCAANYAFANRQIISHLVRETVKRTFALTDAEAAIGVVYDVAHNICKLETHLVEGKECQLYVHRKGATRAFPAGHPEIPAAYRTVGQPVIIPGTMGTSSYVLVGTEKALAETWGSTCHGAGRMMSRHEAIRQSRGRSIADELASQGILVRAASRSGLAEEMPKAYKDVDEVVAVVEGAGLSRKVARMTPLAVMKG